MYEAYLGQLGGSAEWIGMTVPVLASIGLIVIQQQKLARTRIAICRTIERRVTFGEYRALMGLLEHLRFSACLQPDGNDTVQALRDIRGVTSRTERYSPAGPTDDE